jgi:hypothetical protein
MHVVRRGRGRTDCAKSALRGGLMQILVWGGAAVTVCGLLGLIWSIVLVMRARKTSADDAALRAAMQGALVWNLGALALSAVGLMAVVLGVFLA